MYNRVTQTKNELRGVTSINPAVNMVLVVLKNIAISLAQIVDMMREGTYQ